MKNPKPTTDTNTEVRDNAAESDELRYTKCPECGAELQATAKLYLYGVTVNADGQVIAYEGGPQPDSEDEILEICDADNTVVYCANDHQFDPTKVSAESKA